jgi:hypothetical protein
MCAAMLPGRRHPPSLQAITQRLVTLAHEQRWVLQRRTARDIAGQTQQGKPDDKVAEPQGPAADVQAAVTVLGRCKLPPDGLRPLDLTRVDLQGAQLAGANLRSAVLTGANQGARLDGANLQSVQLGGANLQDARLIDANLQDARLGYADLGYARLVGANLQGAQLGGAELWAAWADKATRWPAGWDQGQAEARGVGYIGQPVSTKVATSRSAGISQEAHP